MCRSTRMKRRLKAQKAPWNPLQRALFPALFCCRLRDGIAAVMVRLAAAYFGALRVIPIMDDNQARILPGQGVQNLMGNASFRGKCQMRGIVEGIDAGTIFRSARNAPKVCQKRLESRRIRPESLAEPLPAVFPPGHAYGVPALLQIGSFVRSNERKETLRVMVAAGKGFLQTPECGEAGKRTRKAAEAVEVFLCNIAEALQKKLLPAKIRTGFYFLVPVQVFPLLPQHGFCIQPFAAKKVL